MFIEVTSLCELAMTKLTGVGLGCIMHAHVNGQMMPVYESLLADITLVWTDSQMHFFVLAQHAGLAERFPANVASVKFVCAVGLDMTL